MKLRIWIGLFVGLCLLISCSTNLSGATVLELPEGEVTKSFEFEAMDPRQWSFKVNVTAPIETAVDVTFLTADGATLNIFETPSNPEKANCVQKPEGFLDCMTSFPILEAREPGTWTAVVHKTTEPAVFGGVGPGGVGNLVGAAAYNPETDSWRRLADLPYGLERTADAALGDGVIYAWPSSFGAIRTPGPLLYDLEADEWNPMPEPPQPAPSTPSLEWTGHVLFAYGAASDTDGEAIGLAVTFDPATQTWESVPPAPLEPVPHSEGTEASQATTWTGQEVIVWTGWVGTDWEDPVTRVAAYDPSTGTWRELEPAPIPAQGLWHAPITWTGNQLIPYTNPMLTYKP